MGMMTAMGSGGTNNNNPGTVGGPTGMMPYGQFGFTPFGQVLQQVIPQTPAANDVRMGTWDNLPQSTTPKVYQQTYSNTPPSQISGEAFNTGENSNSGIAAILAGLYNSGVFNQQQLNPYAPQGTVGSFSGIPYGQQQESMFSHSGLNRRNPYGGYQGQSWNPYGNYYTANNTSMGGGNTNNNIAPPQGSTGPDALQQLSSMMNRNNTQI